jgi:hypothetical protein
VRLATRKPFSASVSSASRSSRLQPSAGVEAARASRDATSVDTSSCASENVFMRNTSSRAGTGTWTLNIEGCITDS